MGLSISSPSLSLFYPSLSCSLLSSKQEATSLPISCQSSEQRSRNYPLQNWSKQSQSGTAGGSRGMKQGESVSFFWKNEEILPLTAEMFTVVCTFSVHSLPPFWDLNIVLIEWLTSKSQTKTHLAAHEFNTSVCIALHPSPFHWGCLALEHPFLFILNTSEMCVMKFITMKWSQNYLTPQQCTCKRFSLHSWTCVWGARLPFHYCAAGSFISSSPPLMYPALPSFLISGGVRSVEPQSHLGRGW